MCKLLTMKLYTIQRPNLLISVCFNKLPLGDKGSLYSVPIMKWGIFSQGSYVEGNMATHKYVAKKFYV